MGDAADVALKLAMMLLGAGAVYGGIRADLKTTRERAIEALNVANRAHRRIDDHIEHQRRRDDIG